MNNLFLKPNEAKFLAIATLSMIERAEASSKNELYNWTPETRKDLKDMIEAGKSLRIKLQKLGFDMSDLPPYIDGDENEFLTNES